MDWCGRFYYDDAKELITKMNMLKRSKDGGLKMAIRTTEDWERLKRVNLYLWGKESRGGGFYKRWLEKYERDLAEEESWLRANPNNEITRANVERLRKQVEEYRKLEALYP